MKRELVLTLDVYVKHGDSYYATVREVSSPLRYLCLGDVQLSTAHLERDPNKKSTLSNLHALRLEVDGVLIVSEDQVWLSVSHYPFICLQRNGANSFLSSGQAPCRALL